MRRRNPWDEEDEKDEEEKLMGKKEGEKEETKVSFTKED